MKLKFIQVNIYKGKFLDALVDFLKTEDADIIAMQEVAAGDVSFFENRDLNLFEYLKEKLGMNGVFHSDIDISDSKNSLFGNAVFSKFPILRTKIVTLASYRPFTLEEFQNNIGNIWASVPRHVLDATLDVDGTKVHAMSAHGRRIAPPKDDEENLRQAGVIAEHLKSLRGEPYILGGDFNMPLGSKTVDTISAVSNNLMEGLGVSQTLNPRVHILKDKGYLVDLVFTSGQFKSLNVEVPQVDVSDHLPIVAELEFNK